MRARETLVATALGALIALAAPPADAFCGFYVAKADAELFNESSQVAIVRNGDRTVLTMANDYRGEPEEFAMVVPVPTFITEEQINVAAPGLLEHLDAFTAPRLVEYFDPDPCSRWELKSRMAAADMAQEAPAAGKRERDDDTTVLIEAAYTVGEYDILILSAEQSDGLERWLRTNGYRVPDGASRVLSSYLKQGNRFFVARVNLDEQARLGFARLRPLQIAFESPKFMLPIRLGTVNADGDQDLIVYTLTRKGRVETTNYRNVKLPTGNEIPTYVKDEFGDFYKAMFERQVEANRRSVFLEYAWNMSWCDPCAADPLSRDQLRQLGVFWLDGDGAGRGVKAQAQEVYVTRLHVRYNGDSFPEDLVFQETSDTSNFQGRYVLRHAWQGDSTCESAQAYRRELRDRREREARTLASLTGWDINTIRATMGDDGTPLEDPVQADDRQPWWRRLWGRSG